MTTDDSASFRSIRRALKICSFIFVAGVFLQTPFTVSSVNRTAQVYIDMMTEPNASLPFVFQVSMALANYMFFYLLAVLIILAIALFVTIKSKGGAFLYLNFSILILAWSGSTALLLTAQQLLRMPLEKL